jgi:HEAT repeat protein
MKHRINIKRVEGGIIFLLFLVVGVGCSTNRIANPTPTSDNALPYAQEDTLPTPAKQLDEIIRNISSDDPGVRLVSIRALENFGDQAAKAVPALREALFDDSSEIRINSAIQLGNLGPKAVDSVSDLQTVLENDMGMNVRKWAARSLGMIGSRSSVPILVNSLDVDNEFLAIESAEAIARITGEHFRDAGYTGGYFSNSQGIPNIVIDARKWWEEEGQYQDWDGQH